MKLFGIAVFFGFVHGFGSEGHTIIGALADQLLTEKTIRDIQNLGILDLRSVANWGDDITRVPKYQRSKSFHFIHIGDSKIQIARDCPQKDCLVSAISQYTWTAMCSNSVPLRRESFKFLTHLIAESSQPLHLSGRARGGNDLRVTFDGYTSNLHQVLDTKIVVKRLQEFGGLENYIAYLKNFIATRDTTAWTSVMSINKQTRDGNSIVAIEYLEDSNKLNLAGGILGAYDADQQQDFGSEFYKNQKYLMDIQLAKGAVRLSNWLNQISSKC